MAEFLVEVYVSRADGTVVESSAHNARLAAEGLSREGRPVHYVRSIFVPEDETCFLLYEAPSIDAVRAAAKRAGLDTGHITKTLNQAEGERR
jgi:hypothetical protein